MRKVATFHRWGILTGIACGLALLPIASRSASAEIISITIVANGVTIPVDGLVLSGASSTNYGTVDLTTLNGLLAGAGSAYQFSALGGSSNYGSAQAGGILSLSGGISIPSGMTGSTSLTITETESGFTTSGASSGTLASSSTGNFNNAGTGNSHMADSTFNASPSTPLYTVASTKTGPDFEGNGASTMITSFASPYMLTNYISFSLVPGTGPVDGFSVTSKATAVPEPASMVTMLIGLPIPLLGIAWLRRRTSLANA